VYSADGGFRSSVGGSRTEGQWTGVRPMFACDDMHASFGDELPRVAQMVRDPFDMVVSGYLYHKSPPRSYLFTHTCLRL
jgi:hypothetical protein